MHHESLNLIPMSCFPSVWCVGDFFAAFRKLIVPIKYLHVTGSLPRALFLTYEEILLVLLSLALGI